MPRITNGSPGLRWANIVGEDGAEMAVLLRPDESIEGDMADDARAWAEAAGLVIESGTDALIAASTPVPPPPDVKTEPFLAVHRGRGSWSVMLGKEEVVEGLDKDQATAFNALDDDGKAAAVEYALAAKD